MKPARAQRPPRPRPGRRRPLKAPVPEVVVTWAEEDDPAAVDFAVGFLQRLLARSAER